VYRADVARSQFCIVCIDPRADLAGALPPYSLGGRVGAAAPDRRLGQERPPPPGDVAGGQQSRSVEECAFGPHGSLRRLQGC